MAGLDPAIHDFLEEEKGDVDARVKPGHDELWLYAQLSRLIVRTSLPAALMRAMASRVFSITVAM